MQVCRQLVSNDRPAELRFWSGKYIKQSRSFWMGELKHGELTYWRAAKTVGSQWPAAESLMNSTNGRIQSAGGEGGIRTPDRAFDPITV
jgi:hypothetical protein